jgi:hypothetical protein
MSSNRTLLSIGAGILALVVVGAVVVLLAEARQPDPFEPGTPQAAMQDYLAAWDDGDYETAYGFFSEEVQAEASLDEYESQVRSYGDPYGGGSGSRAAFIDEVEGDGQRVVLHLTVEEYFGDGPADGGSYRSQRQVRMVREADGWKIDEPLIWLEPTEIGEFRL